MDVQHPLRTDEERLKFCDVYFDAVGAERTVERPMYREYVLPRDVDKELTDRPFYWLWVERTNQHVEPTTLRLAFSDEAKQREDARLVEEHQQMLAAQQQPTGYDILFRKPKQTERIDLGCFRLEKLFDSVRERGKTVSVCPAQAPEGAVHVPWMMLNGLIQQVTDSVSEEWFSVGICLANLQVEFNFYDKIAHIPMRGCAPSRVLGGAKHTAAEAVQRAKAALEKQIAQKDHHWAEEARERLMDDLAQLDTYYSSMRHEDDPERQAAMEREHQRKREQLIAKSTPRIAIQLSQIGIVGLPLVR